MIQKVCPFCEEKFDQDLVKDHIGIEHFVELKAIKEEDKPFTCEKCDNFFKEESDLKIHRNIAHPIVKFTCEICQKQFSNKHSYNLHMKYLHAHINFKPNSYQFKCDQCEKQYKEKHHLKRHKEAFHLRKRFKCEECSKDFWEKEALKQHVSSAHRGITLKCDQCPQLFHANKIYEDTWQIFMKGRNSNVINVQNVLLQSTIWLGI